MDQALALEILMSGQSAFLTGAAGSGKTFLLKEFIREAKAAGQTVAITASTGIAATHLGGGTIHSWSGLGVRDFLSDKFFQRMSDSRQTAIRAADVLIIDEISMLHSWQLDLIDQILRRVRESPSRPFGGLQVILSGDFFQLPPVGSRSLQNFRQSSPGDFDGVDQIPAEPATTFAYNSTAWQNLDPVILYLTAQHRQDDAEFLDILNKIRAGEVRRADAEKIAARLNAPIDGLRGEATILETHNFNVDRINDQKLRELPGEAHIFPRQTAGRKEHVERLARSCLAPEPLILKTGALVMTLKNDLKKRYVNGSIGRVVGFDKNKNGWPIMQLRSGRTLTIEPDEWNLTDGEKQLASIVQIPLRPAYAITVHKSQGMTLDAARVNLARVFEPGMGYVALSRVKSLDSLSIAGLNSLAFKVHPEVLEVDKKFRKRSCDDAARFEKLRPAAEKRAREIARREKRGEKSGAKNRSNSISNFQKDSGKSCHPDSTSCHPELVSGSSQNSAVDTDAETKAARSKAWADKLAKMREIYPNAYRPWSADDDARLAKLAPKKSVKELTKIFGRHPGSIRARIEKLQNPNNKN
ncbi:MAG: AAA family ATPase [Candidatus Nomurabacteria bacterium]|jgi:ATP-dependent exoDNAse (exonuclease V) alpha subunit|nr:AAA family ATPase [Candidatus Nomurabacteria bacterium]